MRNKILFMERLQKILPKNRANQIIIALTLWQFISVGLMAVGTWPARVALFNTLLLTLFILLAKPFYSVLLLIISIPFFVIMPNPIVANIPMWRFLFALLFTVWFVQLLVSQRAWLEKMFSFKQKREGSYTAAAGNLAPNKTEIFVGAIKRLNTRLMPWDKIVFLFFVLATVSLLIARFPMHGLKQIIFLLNIYLFYIVIISVTTDREKLNQVIRYTIYSLGIMVGLGFIQYLGTLFASPYYFWQYWATMVSGLYYGVPLANVLAYSNSWFSANAGGSSLRMFGILPDTHAFGVMCIFLLAYLVPSLHWPKTQTSTGFLTTKPRWYIVVLVVLAGFGVMASGTRGVWLSMLAPLGISALAYWLTASRNILSGLKSFFKIMLAVYGVIILLFLVSPLISKTLNYIRTVHTQDDFLNRAGSIYDLNESSNAGRIEIWKNSLKFAAVHPFGVGYGNFVVSIVTGIPANATYEQVASMKNLRYNLPEAFITAHSLYLQLLVELGFAGVLAFLLLWWEYFETLWNFLKERNNVGSHKFIDLSLSLALAFIWILAYGVFDVTILNDRVLQYLMISLAISGLIFVKDGIMSEIN